MVRGTLSDVGSPRTLLHAALTAATIVLVSSCAAPLPIETALKNKATGVRAHHDSSGYSVVIQSGNLIDSTVFSAEERNIWFQDFLSRYRAEFGVAGTEPLDFVADGAEFDLEFEGRMLAGVKLLQSVEGVRILEGEQLGLFDLESGALRAVTVRLTEASALKDVARPASQEGIAALAGRFLDSSGVAADSLTVVEGPAYSLVLRMSGYEVRCMSQVGQHAPAMIRLLVNPDTRTVAFLSRLQYP